MTQENISTLDRLWGAWASRLPVLSPEEQRAGLALLRELAKGEPVAAAQPPALKPFIYPDEQGRVVGFLGLSTRPMHHRFALNGRTLWTWCAQDSLFLPELLDETAEVESRDPEGGELVSLTISPSRVEAVGPAGAVVSLVNPDATDLSSAARIMATACHFIFFFASRAAGERWVAMHPGTLLLSLNEAFTFGKRWNASLFGTELARRGAGAADVTGTGADPANTGATAGRR